MRFLLDTNVLSEFHKGRSGDENVLRWSTQNDQADFAISVITLKELEYGVLNLAHSDAARSLSLRAWLDHFVLPRFGEQLISVDIRVAIQAAALDVPTRRPTADGLIAATALVHGLIMVTRNVAHFRSMGVRLLNPWTA